MPHKPRQGPLDRARDMVRASRRIFQKTAGRSYEQFVRDQDAVEVVCYQILIIGEAVPFLPDALKTSHPDLDWVGMKLMRNVMAHVYFNIDMEILWRTATREVPELCEAVEDYLRQIADSSEEPLP